MKTIHKQTGKTLETPCKPIEIIIAANQIPDRVRIMLNESTIELTSAEARALKDGLDKAIIEAEIELEDCHIDENSRHTCGDCSVKDGCCCF